MAEAAAAFEHGRRRSTPREPAGERRPIFCGRRCKRGRASASVGGRGLDVIHSIPVFNRAGAGPRACPVCNVQRSASAPARAAYTGASTCMRELENGAATRGRASDARCVLRRARAAGTDGGAKATTVGGDGARGAMITDGGRRAITDRRPLRRLPRIYPRTSSEHEPLPALRASCPSLRRASCSCLFLRPIPFFPCVSV